MSTRDIVDAHPFTKQTNRNDFIAARIVDVQVTIITETNRRRSAAMEYRTGNVNRIDAAAASNELDKVQKPAIEFRIVARNIGRWWYASKR